MDSLPQRPYDKAAPSDAMRQARADANKKAIIEAWKAGKETPMSAHDTLMSNYVTARADKAKDEMDAYFAAKGQRPTYKDDNLGIGGKRKDQEATLIGGNN